MQTWFQLEQLPSWESLQWLSQPLGMSDSNALMLRYEGSLTQFLCERTGQHAEVTRLSETWQHNPGLAKQFHLRQRQLFWNRNILMGDGIQPWIYAETWVPSSSIKGEWRQIPLLGNRPLGHWLFEHRSIHRSSFKFALIPSLGWVRQSQFQQKSSKLALYELFSPDLIDG